MSECYFIVSAHGQKIEVTKAVFIAFERMLVDVAATGRIEIDCRNGGVSGVRISETIK